MPKQNQYTLTQEEIEMRRALDAEFAAFMKSSDQRYTELSARVNDNTRITNEVHTALFAKNSDNEFGTPGLVVMVQQVVNHTRVVCNIARFFKWLAVATLAAGVSAVAFLGDVKAFLGSLQALLS